MSQDQVPFHRERELDKLKLFGYTLWGDDDESKKPTEPIYNTNELVKNLRLTFMGQAYNSFEFYNMVTQKIQGVNQQMGSERIKMNNSNILGVLPQDIIYKIGLVMYGKQWTYVIY